MRTGGTPILGHRHSFLGEQGMEMDGTKNQIQIWD